MQKNRHGSVFNLSILFLLLLSLRLVPFPSRDKMLAPPGAPPAFPRYKVMLCPTTKRALLARAPATTAAAFRDAALRSRIFVSSPALRGVTGVDAKVLLAVAPNATFAPAIFVCAGVVFPPAPGPVLTRVAVVLPVFRVFPVGVDTATAALRAARSVLLTRRIAMPCLPLRMYLVGMPIFVIIGAIASEEVLRATAVRRAAAEGPESKAALPVRPVAVWGRMRVRARMRVRFLKRSLFLGGRERLAPTPPFSQPVRPYAHEAHPAAQCVGGCPKCNAGGIADAYRRRRTTADEEKLNGRGYAQRRCEYTAFPRPPT